MRFLSFLISGLSLGSIYAIIALGYTMVYGIAKMLNFAHGDVIMVGSYICFFAMMRYNLPPVVGVILAMIISIPVTTLAGNAVFSIMGAASVKWVYSIESLLKYPVILEAVTVLITFFTALYTRTINARDTASIE